MGDVYLLTSYRYVSGKKSWLPAILEYWQKWPNLTKYWNIWELSQISWSELYKMTKYKKGKYQVSKKSIFSIQIRTNCRFLLLQSIYNSESNLQLEDTISRFFVFNATTICWDLFSAIFFLLFLLCIVVLHDHIVITAQKRPC